MSPGKAAAAAAAAAAKEAARAAAASVRAAEAAADAAEAAEAAAEAEDEASQTTPSPGGGAFRSPPATSSERRDRVSPGQSAFWLTEKDIEGATERHKGSGSPKQRSPRANDDHPPTYRADEEDGGGRGDGDSHQERAGRRGEDEGRWRREGNERRSSEEEKLKKARDQVGSCASTE